MCVSSAPARFTRTTVYAGEARRNGDLVHVLGYENTVQSRIKGRRLLPWGKPATGNAMLLHFPAVPSSMSQRNVVDTESCPRILRDMVAALFPAVADAIPAKRMTLAPTVEVFDSGIYTVVLASDASAIPGALDRVAPQRRPDVKPKLFSWYARHFRDWPVALCCFDNREARHATPMLWWYEPRFPDLLFAPAVDAHTGGPPDLERPVDVDHHVALGSTDGDSGVGVTYSDPLSDEVRSLLPTHVVGASYVNVRMDNGDFVAPVESVRRAQPRIERRVLLAA